MVGLRLQADAVGQRTGLVDQRCRRLLERVEPGEGRGRSLWPITALRLPSTGSKRNSDLASCGCTLSMSIRKLSAPRLSARRSKVPAFTACCGSTSV
jgi:hypothetical protein